MKTTVIGGSGRTPKADLLASKSARFAAQKHDPTTRTGLLPRDNSRSHEGVKTYVLSGGAGSSGGRGGNRFNKATSFDVLNSARDRELRDGKERLKRREEEEKSLSAMLKRNSKMGLSSLGSVYLSKLKGEKKDSASAANGGGSDDDDDDDDNDGEGGSGKKKSSRAESAFTASSIRAIGYDPTRTEGERESRESELKRVSFVPLSVDGRFY
jgi:minichromosome maintenance protein 10